MGDNKVIEMFDSIPKFETYSKYSNTLGRVFKNSSLDSLLKDLKNPKKFDEKEGTVQDKNFTDNITSIENQIANAKNIIDENDDFFDKKYDKKNLMKKEQDSENENKTPKIIHKRKKVLPDNPDPYKYHPNYNSIYKNVPSVKFILPKEKKSYIKNLEEEKNKKLLDKKLKLKPIETDKKVLLTDINIENKNTITNNNLSTQVKTEESKELEKNNKTKKKQNLLPPISKSNHALKFTQYTWRKFIIPVQNEKISYLEPYDYLENVEKSIDFNKMRPRQDMDMLNKHHLETPSINYYNPRYDYIENRSPKVKFSPSVSKLKYDNSKYLVNKLWASYNVSQEYKLVDNDKLGEPNFDYLQFGD